MNILSIERARVGAIVRLDEAFPLTGIYPPTIARAMAERYSFIYQPDWSLPLSKMQAKGMEFRAGKFQASDGKEQVIQDLVVAGFGVVASCYSTEIAKEFLGDLFSWADTEYECRFSSADVKFFFLSQLMVQFDRNVNTIIKAFELLSGKIGRAIESTYGDAYPVELSSVGFDYDRTSAIEEMRELSAFVIERQLGKSYATNSFFCQAPLSTRDHITLLEYMENELKE